MIKFSRRFEPITVVNTSTQHLGIPSRKWCYDYREEESLSDPRKEMIKSSRGFEPIGNTVNTAPTRGRQGKLEAFRAVRGVKYTSRTFGGEKYSRLLGNRTTDHPGFHAQCPDH